MKVRFFTQPQGEKYAGQLMVEKTIQDHTSAGVKPTVHVAQATEQDKAQFPADFLAFTKSAELPVADVAETDDTADPDASDAAPAEKRKYTKKAGK